MTNIGTIDNLQNRNLVDQENLQERKLYLYKITNHNDKGFIKEQSLSIIHLEQVGVINAVRAEERQTLTQENRQNNSKGNTALIVPRTSGMQYTTEEHFDTNGVVMASFDEVIITNGKTEQELFFVDNVERNLIRPRMIHGKKTQYNPTDFSLTNVKDITNNYNALGFLYTFEKEMIDPTNVTLSMDNYTLLSKVMAKGKVDGKNHQDIDLEVEGANSSKLSLLTMAPTSTNYKLSMFSHWLDSNRTLAFVKAKTYITVGNLKDLFNAANGDFAGWSTAEIEDAYKVVIGMMKLTQAYATNFSEYRTGTDGKIGESEVINGIKLIDFADKTPINAIDGFVEAWKGKYPGQVDSAGFKILLEVVAMLSNNINSTYAIAKGNTDFHKVYLPWYFVPQTAINKALADDGDLNVILKSEYFDFTQANPLQIKDEYKDISGYLAHDLNGWISQPELPNQLAPISKYARPGDISTTSDNDLKYLFYIPFKDETVLEKLYGEVHSSTTTGWHDEGITRRYDNTNWSAKVSNSHNDGSTVDVTPFTHDGKSTFETRDTRIDKNTLNNANIMAFLDNPTATVVEKLLNIPVNARLKPGSITNISIKYVSGENGYRGNTGTELILSIGFDYQLEINGDTTISSIQHKGTIYDKLNWRSVCNSLTDGSDNYQLSLVPNHKFKLNIDAINEINIQAVWLDNISITMTNATGTLRFTNIELPSMDDESLCNFSILL